jgi:hypothetical protein
MQMGHRNAGSAKREAVDWMKHHSIDDLKNMVGELEKSGQDASHIRAIIADLTVIERDLRV